MKAPSPNGGNGRGDARLPGRHARGRFASGNPGGPGNPYAKQAGRLRSALMESVTEKDMRAVAARLISLAKGGNIQAIKELLDRTLGKPHEADLIERLEQLEQALLHRAGK